MGTWWWGVAFVSMLTAGSVGCGGGSDGEVARAGSPGDGGSGDGSVRDGGDPPDLAPLVLDDGFGDDGVIRVQSLGSTDWIWAADRAPDGDLLAAGGTTNGLGRRYEALVVRFDGADGSRDASWGERGVALLSFHEGATITAIEALDDGGAMVAGYSQYGLDNLAFLARLGSDGSLDESFGTGGITSWEGDPSGVVAIAVADDGATFVLSERGASERNQLRRVTADGSIDTSFGDAGVATLIGQQPRELLLRPDGSLLALTGVSSGTTPGFLTRVTATGAIDTEFGDEGTVRIRFHAYAMAASPTGDEILVVGGTPPMALEVDAATGGPVADFGTDGYLSVPGSEELLDVAWLPGAGIVVLEADELNFPAAQPVAVHRMDADGAAVAFDSAAIEGRPRGSYLSHLFATDSAVYLVGSELELTATEVEATVVALDPTGAPLSGFGTAGVARAPSTATSELFWEMARVGDGSVVASGPSFLAGLLVRFADGAQDLSFGDGGYVNTNPIAGPFIGMAADGDRILGAAGTDLVRLLPDGTRDNAFGDMGEALGVPDLASLHAAAVDGEGRILAAGEIIAGETLVVRVLADGTPDSTFGEAGVASGIVEERGSFFSVLAEDDGIVLGGLGSGQTLVVRVGLDGALDPTFGDGGFTTIAGGPWAYRLLPRRGGGYLLGGGSTACREADCPVSVVALRADGTVDPSFGDAGTASVTGRFFTGPVGLTQLTDGSILLGAAISGNQREQLSVWRFSPDGRLDESLGDGGVLTLPDRGRATAMVPDGDGALVAGWHSHPVTGTDAIVLRLRAP